MFWFVKYHYLNSIIVGVLFFLARGYIAAVYTQDPNIHPILSNLLLVYSFALILDMVIYTLLSAMRSLDEVDKLLWINLSNYTPIVVIGGFITTRILGWGVVGLVCNFLLAQITFSLRVYYNIWNLDWVALKEKRAAKDL